MMGSRTVRNRKRRLVGGGAIALAMIATACGSDNSGGSAAPSTTAGASTTAAATTTAAAATSAVVATTTAAATGATPTDIAGYEKLWDSERAATVKQITDSGWGLQADGKTVTGPDGFTINLSTCGAGWSNTAGLTDTEIKLGFVLPQSGPLAEAGNAAGAAKAYYDYVNKNGGIEDSAGKTRQISLTVRDDGYDPARTIPLVDELVDSVKVFDIQTLGSAPVLRTYDSINKRCVPNVFDIVGHPAAGDPVNHPWTTGILLSYSSEATLWGTYIDKMVADGGGAKVKVAALVLNNDSGKAFDGALKAYIAKSANKDNIEYTAEFVEASAPSVTDPMTTLASGNPDVFISMTTGTICSQSVTEAAQNGLKDSAKQLFVASICSSFLTDKAVGDASDGYQAYAGGVRTFVSPTEASNPFVAWVNDTLLKGAGVDPMSSTQHATGILSALPIVQALEVAGDLPGGLTRANFIVAVRALTMTHPAYLDGMKFNLSGATDAYPIEGSALGKWSAAKQGFVIEGAVVDVSGQSPPCAWDASAGLCK